MSGKSHSNPYGREASSRTAKIESNWANRSRFRASVRVGLLSSPEVPALLDASLLAIAQLNQTGGVLGRAIEPITIESAADVPIVLQDPSLNAIFGGWTSEERQAVLPLLETYDGFLWYPAPYEGLENSDRVFYTGGCPNQPVEFAMDWLLQQQKRCIYLLGCESLFSKTTHALLKAQFKQHGVILVGEDYLNARSEEEIAAAIARIQRTRPDLAINTLDRADNLSFYRQLHAAGLNAKTTPTLAFHLSELELEAIGEATAGHYSISSYFHRLQRSETQHFIATFQQQSKTDRITTAALATAYTQIHLWKQAVELAESFDLERLRPAAYGQRFLAPNGFVTLETNHHLSQPYAIARATSDGQFEIVANSDRALKPLPWLGVEAQHFNPSEVLVEVLSDVSHWVRRSHDLENQNRLLEAQLDRARDKIASHQQMEEAMRNYGLKLRALFAAIGDVIFVTDREGTLLELAPTDPHNPHKPPADCIGRSLHDLFEPALADTFLQHLSEALETQQTLSFEYCRPHDSTGSSVWFSVNLSPIAQEESVIWIQREITEQKQLQSARETAQTQLEQQIGERTAALVESNESLIAEIVRHQHTVEVLQTTRDQLQAVLEAVPGIVSWISSDLHYLGVNRHLARTFGLEVDNFVEQPIGFLQASSEFNDFVRRFFASPLQEDSQEISALTDSQWRNYLIVAQKYDEGRAAFTVGIDVTDRVRATEGLKATKDRLEAVLEAVPGIVSWISSDLRYLGVNRHLAQTFGLSPEEFTNKPIGFLQVSPEFNEFVRDFFASPRQEAYREISSCANGELQHYLVVAQKYDEGRAAFTIGIDISDRVRALEGLRQAEEKYRAIFENTVEGIFQTTPDGYYLSANPALARIYGYDSPEQLIAELRSIERQLYVDPQRRQEFIQQVEERGAVVDFESRVYRRDGTIAWISENARVVRDARGHILYYEGTVEDIGKRKKSEEQLKQLNEQLEFRVRERTDELQQLNLQLLLEIGERERISSALRQSEAELKALFAAMTDVISVFDRHGRYVKIVTTNSELLYSPASERIGKTVYEIFPSETAEIYIRHIRQVLQTGKTVNLEYCLTVEASESQPHADSSSASNEFVSHLNPTNAKEIWFAASVSPLPDNYAIWVSRNITERRRVLQAVQEAEAKYRSIFENAAEGIFQSTPEGRYLSANPALVRMYGYESFADLAACVSHIGRQLYVNPQQRAILLERVERTGAVSEYQVQIRRKDGGLIWVSENVRAVRDERGNTRYYEGTVQDITQRKRVEDALHLEQEKSERLLLNILPERIAERLKQEQQAIAESFDLITILFADIVGFTELSASITPSKLVEMLNQIFSTFDRLAQKYGLEKIKTIGDAYMVAGGFSSATCDPQQPAEVASAIADMALAMQRKIRAFKLEDGQPLHLRVGINSGPVVAGAIGVNKPIYDLWGDTVNVASRMESHGLPGKIQVTAQTYNLLKERYRFQERGLIAVKGRGQMMTYWLTGKARSRPRSETSS
ncbi:MAG: transporter substrate-binding protein [Cyanobacteriota bacterium]|nr:transporter substrate-binding protein [Cyanobacteriota bacterium]